MHLISPNPGSTPIRADPNPQQLTLSTETNTHLYAIQLDAGVSKRIRCRTSCGELHDAAPHYRFPVLGPWVASVLLIAVRLPSRDLAAEAERQRPPGAQPLRALRLHLPRRELTSRVYFEIWLVLGEVVRPRCPARATSSQSTLCSVLSSPLSLLGLAILLVP